MFNLKTVCLALSFVFAGLASAQAALPDRAAVQRMVVEEALRNGTVPPALALGVAKVESGFQADAESPVGARGVMQIMPATARSEFQVSADRLWDARTNIRLGVTYLERLYRQYGNRWDAALSHYNGGTLKGGRGAQARPHDYTRGYVSDVFAWAWRFERDQTAGTLVAEVEQSRPIQLAAATGNGETPYWLFDKPGVERGWRDYLKSADGWLKTANPHDPEPFRDVWEPPVSSDVAAPAATEGRPSDLYRQRNRDFRRSILNKINQAPDHKPAPRTRPRFG